MTLYGFPKRDVSRTNVLPQKAERVAVNVQIDETGTPADKI